MYNGLFLQFGVIFGKMSPDNYFRYLATLDQNFVHSLKEFVRVWDLKYTLVTFKTIAEIRLY